MRINNNYFYGSQLILYTHFRAIEVGKTRTQDMFNIIYYVLAKRALSRRTYTYIGKIIDLGISYSAIQLNTV